METVELYDGRKVSATKLLVALYNNTQPLGMGVLQARLAPKFDELQAKRELDLRSSFRFDYLYGRPLKVFAVDGVITQHSALLYDRDAGEGMFEKSVQEAMT